MQHTGSTPNAHNVDAFIESWSRSEGSERANYQGFLRDLCDVLGVERPHPTLREEQRNAYVFEKNVLDVRDDSRRSVRRIDLYKRGCFVLEAKQGIEQQVTREVGLFGEAYRVKTQHRGHGTRKTTAWDVFMQRAKQQAENYVRLLPESEGRPPFILVADVGYVIEVYAEITCTGGVYRPFPNAKASRIMLEDLRSSEVRELLRTIWEDPLSLDPSKKAAEVTKQVADKLARLSRSLEKKTDASGQPLTPERVSGFLMRMIFTMFAEDVGLIPNGKFSEMLERMRRDVAGFVPNMRDLWTAMAKGEYSLALQQKMKHFNGGVFEDTEVLGVTQEELEGLIDASRHDWGHVEPSIFGTLVERALNPRERHKLGAHYTPRAYVERLVEQVEIQQKLSAEKKGNGQDNSVIEAQQLVEKFLAQLRHTTVLYQTER